MEHVANLHVTTFTWALAVLILSLLLVFGPTNEVYATPGVWSTPSGGNYNTAQSVILNATEPTAIIYYTTNGNVPTNASMQYNGDPIVITNSTTLKFIAIDPSGNHTSEIVTENYTITPQVMNTQPSANETEVTVKPIINATFSEPMNGSTITSDTFKVTFNNGANTVIGTISYNSTSSTASFIPDKPTVGPWLAANTLYTVTLTKDIRDQFGNPLAEDYSWNFTTCFSMTIIVHDVLDRTVQLPGSEFTVTPNPFTLSGNLVVQDNDANDKSDQDGRIELEKVKPGTFVISESVVPVGYAKVYDNLIFTVHKTDPGGTKFFGNRDTSIPIEDLGVFDAPAPHLTAAQLQLYLGNATVGIFDGIQGDELSFPSPISGVDNLDASLPALMVDPAILAGADLSGLSSLVFTSTLPAGTSGDDIFNRFDIPTYPGAEQDVAEKLGYLAPAIVIPFENSKDNFVLTPVIAKVHQGQTLFMVQPSYVESKVAKFESVNMTFAKDGNNVGFSFGISDTPPPNTPPPPLDVAALFLDIGTVGDLDFSKPNTFQSSPTIDILVNKTLPGFPQLPNGCSDFKLLFFDGASWTEVQKLNPTGNFTDYCPFTLKPGHFSKFGVGGIKGQTINTDVVLPIRSHGGGGRSSFSQLAEIVPTSNINMSSGQAVAHIESNNITISFANLDPGSGNQLSIGNLKYSEASSLFTNIIVGEHGDITGIVKLDNSTFKATGNIFNIDGSAVKFTGDVTVTISFDEKSVPTNESKSNIRLLHYDETRQKWEDTTISIDLENNTLTGKMDSLSPVVVAFVDDGTYGKAYFQMHPLSKIISSTNNSNALVESTHQGDEISIPIMIKNQQRENQQYSIIIEIFDEQGIVQHLALSNGSIPAGQVLNVSQSWLVHSTESYNIRYFIWDTLDDPLPLSEAHTIRAEIRE